MLLPADRLLSALMAEFAKLSPRLADSGTDGSAAQGIANALLLLRNRQEGGAAFVDAQLSGLDAVLAEVRAATGELHAAQIAALSHEIATAKDSPSIEGKEATWRSLLAQAQALASDMAASADLDNSQRSAVTSALVAWEAADRQRQVAPAPQDGGATEVAITPENLTAYLRHRFDDEAMTVTSLTPLAGGFGKETILFDVSGEPLSGAFVMRRDLAGGASLTNDCHRNVMEYPVIKAAYSAGFPAPDAVWLDTDHAMLPGGDFIIMRKSPGKIGGNFFGAQTALPEDLVDSLADIMARLHTLPPLTDLGNLSTSIRTDLWDKPRRDSIADYISGWREFFLSGNHTPSPSLMALFGWLMDHVPPREGRSVLLHGDFGFHNFLFDDGQLTAVLDWEFAHIGDPAEELGYVRETVGNAIDWDRLMARYVAAGGDPVDDATLRYFRVWAHVRNAAASNMIAANFVAGMTDELKLAFLPHVHFPMFITAAHALIAEA